MLKPFGGVPSAKQLQIVKAKTMEVSAILNDPSIDFPIRHARTPVYRHKTYLSNCSDVEIDEAFSVPKYISEICI